jgi:pimeloyl-ACP methyl ester carboxylesterase
MKANQIRVAAILLLAACDGSPKATSLDAEGGEATATEVPKAEPAPEVQEAEVPPPAVSLSCPAEGEGHTEVNVGEVTLHVACRGEGTPVVFLHGFPEFWYGWRSVMDAMGPGYRLIVPDQRGFNLSEKPNQVGLFHIDHLVADLVGLLDALALDQVILVGHDWGGLVAWVAAHRHPARIARLVIANSPHPDLFKRELAENPEQQKASAYIDFLIGEGSEEVLAANDFAFLQGAVFSDAFSEADREAYLAAWAQPGALPAMLNWYRANLAPETAGLPTEVTIQVPTRVLWGMKDAALLAGNLVGLETYVADLQVIQLPDATHWVNHEDPAAIALWVGADPK